MKRTLGTIVGKSMRQLTKIHGSGGQALPGFVVEKLIPNYFVSMLKQLPDGVVVITGTNGKTTTTKMVSELLAKNGKRVLTNSTGSNLTRGINSALAHQASLSGKLPYDIAVFELDEAYARIFAQKVNVRWVLALNVTRDQLDRFGEVDTAAEMIGETMAAATEGIIANANDIRLSNIAEKLDEQKQVKFFGVDDNLRKYFPAENDLVAVTDSLKKAKQQNLLVELADFSSQSAKYTINGKDFSAKLKISGQHNLQNAAAALSLVSCLLPDAQAKDLIKQLEQINPAFGRGEVYKLANNSDLRLVLVKNPAGFRQALASYLPAKKPIMIVINDNVADGRDVSWLWDVDFSELRSENIYCTSGKRAADMALRLHYDDVTTEKVEPDLSEALAQFSELPEDKLLFTTYTAMLQIHKTLNHTGELQK